MHAEADRFLEICFDTDVMLKSDRIRCSLVLQGLREDVFDHKLPRK